MKINFSFLIVIVGVVCSVVSRQNWNGFDVKRICVHAWLSKPIGKFELTIIIQAMISSDHSKNFVWTKRTKKRSYVCVCVYFSFFSRTSLVRHLNVYFLIRNIYTHTYSVAHWKPQNDIHIHKKKRHNQLKEIVEEGVNRREKEIEQRMISSKNKSLSK